MNTRRLRLTSWVLVLLAGIACRPIPATVQAAGRPGQPELPRVYVDTKYVPPTGRTINVPGGGDFQAALAAAQPGDVIALEAGATFTGPFLLPNKRGSGWITIRSSALDGSLPPPGKRVDPSYARVMPKLVARSDSVIATAPGAHHYRFIGIEIRPMPGVFLYNLVLLGSSERVADLPHHIIFDRSYLHGDPKRGTRRGIAMNSRFTAVIDSHLSDFKEAGADSQAICGWAGPGPFKIVNNYLEGAGENVMFGGADPVIPALVPADIELRRNHFSKPLSWKIGDPAFEGTAWTIKNLFELKSARRVLIEGNLFEFNWPHAQNGFAILFTVRNPDGTAPWSVIEDVTFTANVLRHAAAGVNILGRDEGLPSGQAKRIAITHNVVYDVGGPVWGGGGTFLQILNGTADVVIEHNTVFQKGNIITAEGPPHTGFVYRSNITPHNDYGIFGSGTGVGNLTLTRYFPGALVLNNVMTGGSATLYPSGNFFPASLDQVRFVDRANGDYRLAGSSPYKRAAPDRTDLGANFDALARAMALTRGQLLQSLAADLKSSQLR